MKRIGIVEDEAFIREELGEILEKAGYEVVAVKILKRWKRSFLRLLLISFCLTLICRGRADSRFVGS